MMKKNNLRIIPSVWGPIKITADKQTQELWRRISPESIRKVFFTFQERKIGIKISNK